MKLNSVLLTCLISIGLLTISGDNAFARGYFSVGNPGGLKAGLGYPLARTPANQAWETNNAWANYRAQTQLQAPGAATRSSGSALQHNAVTP
jgi:hypothetical protein